MSAETNLALARLWLDARGLTDVAPTPWLATRLAVRRRARLVSAVLLAVFLCAVALVYVSALPHGSAVSLLALTAPVAGLVLALSQLDRWVRRVDRRAGASLRRRAAHPVRSDWRRVLGLPRAALLVTTYVAAVVLAIGSLTVREPASRYEALVLIIGLCGVAVGTVLQLRHVLTHPVVADDEGSLAADFLMRVEDAREIAVPTVVWSLPVVSVFGTGLDVWTAGWLVFVVLSVVALALITVGTARDALAAQRTASAG